MPRTFLMKPRPLDQVPVTSSVTSSVDAASLWLPPVGYDVNNNRSSSTLLGASGCLDLTSARPADNVTRRRPLDVVVAAGLPWWSTAAAGSAAQHSPPSWRDDRGGPVTSSSKRSSSPPPAAATAAAEPVTAADDDVQGLWWSPSPHSDVSASGMNTFHHYFLR